ncbi:DUF6290 family protein [Nocardia mexicana]|uniref:Uncharacterized protein n=1 Tax=Nocardia mexicana TaxID=279262 RepID=A0A370HFP2_9NOCA|nr:DUF6290 family protein [Nocardia mexicana]RDI56051.1 hypothetical protein DFR68_101888 [Nocardia mexicana]
MANPPANNSRSDTHANANTTFSIRLRPQDYRTLMSYANLRKISLAELAREFILDGLRNALDPAEIERQMEEEKQRLLHAAERLRQESLAGGGRDDT